MSTRRRRNAGFIRRAAIRPRRNPVYPRRTVRPAVRRGQATQDEKTAVRREIRDFIAILRILSENIAFMNQMCYDEVAEGQGVALPHRHSDSELRFTLLQQHFFNTLDFELDN